MDIGAILALVGFGLLFGFAIWFGLREWRSLHRWIDHKISHEGWLRASQQEDALADRDWNWLRSMGSRRDVTVDRLAVNPESGPIEAGFTLVTRRYGGRGGGRRHVGVGLIAPLPHAVSPPMVASPGAALAGFRSWFLGFDLPPVTIRDERLARAWSVWSPDPEAGAAALEHDGRVPAALNAVLEEGVGDVAKFQVFILELNGDRVALLGGPKVVGRDPFSDLEVVAKVLTQRMRR